MFWALSAALKGFSLGDVRFEVQDQVSHGLRPLRVQDASRVGVLGPFTVYKWL